MTLAGLRGLSSVPSSEAAPVITIRLEWRSSEVIYQAIRETRRCRNA